MNGVHGTVYTPNILRQSSESICKFVVYGPIFGVYGKNRLLCYLFDLMHSFERLKSIYTIYTWHRNCSMLIRASVCSGWFFNWLKLSAMSICDVLECFNLERLNRELNVYGTLFVLFHKTPFSGGESRVFDAAARLTMSFLIEHIPQICERSKRHQLDKLFVTQQSIQACFHRFHAATERVLYLNTSKQMIY